MTAVIARRPIAFLVLCILAHGCRTPSPRIVRTYEQDHILYGVQAGRSEILQLTSDGRSFSPTVVPGENRIFFVRQVRDLAENPWGMSKNDQNSPF